MDESINYADTVAPLQWAVVGGCILGFFCAVGVGALGVGLSFATTVAAGSLTLKQAMVAAAIFELCGSYFLGPQVANTMRMRILDVEPYQDEPDVVMMGLFTSLLAATMVLVAATRLELPISSTHTILACLVGFAHATKGDAVIDKNITNTILFSWIAAPSVAGVAAFLLYGLVHQVVFRHDNAWNRTRCVSTTLFTMGMFINILFFLRRGLYRMRLDVRTALVLAAFGSAASFLLWTLFLYPWYKHFVHQQMASASSVHDTENANTTISTTTDTVPAGSDTTLAANSTARQNNDMVETAPIGNTYDMYHTSYDPYIVTIDQDEAARRQTAEAFVSSSSSSSAANVEAAPAASTMPSTDRVGDGATTTTVVVVVTTEAQKDLKEIALSENAAAKAIWDNAKTGRVNDPHVAERAFVVLHVLTACTTAIVHGAIDVHNAVGPVSALVGIWAHQGEVRTRFTVLYWMLAYVSFGIGLGILLFGYRVTKSIGYKLTILSPARAVCAQLVASALATVAMDVGIPFSFTCALVGAIIGVGMADGKNGASHVNWCFALRIVLAWVASYFGAMLLSLLLFLAFEPLLY